MQTLDISFKRHRFPPQIVSHAVWLYLRFNLRLREVEEMLLEPGIGVSCETVRAGPPNTDPGSPAICDASRHAPAMFGIWTKSS